MDDCRYVLRYTSDLMEITSAHDVESLIRKSDYKIHVYDTRTGKVVWQNSESKRYGSVGVVA